jgi:DUF971 family protein
MSVPEPIEIGVKPDGSLGIAWEDGHQSVYPLRYLRGNCPCAHCQGHGAGGKFIANDSPRIAALEEVGAYAINIRYAGGHVTGIYSFDLLRKLCPCQGCLDARGDAHPFRQMPA